MPRRSQPHANVNASLPHIDAPASLSCSLLLIHHQHHQHHHCHHRVSSLPVRFVTILAGVAFRGTNVTSRRRAARLRAATCSLVLYLSHPSIYHSLYLSISTLLLRSTHLPTRTDLLSCSTPWCWCYHTSCINCLILSRPHSVCLSASPPRHAPASPCTAMSLDSGTAAQGTPSPQAQALAGWEFCPLCFTPAAL